MDGEKIKILRSLPTVQSYGPSINPTANQPTNQAHTVYTTVKPNTYLLDTIHSRIECLLYSIDTVTTIEFIAYVGWHSGYHGLDSTLNNREIT